MSLILIALTLTLNLLNTYYKNIHVYIIPCKSSSSTLRYILHINSYLSKVLGSKFDHCGESILPMLVILIQNSAKIMSSSAMVALKLIIQVFRKGNAVKCLFTSLSSPTKLQAFPHTILLCYCILFNPHFIIVYICYRIVIYVILYTCTLYKHI